VLKNAAAFQNSTQLRIVSKPDNTKGVYIKKTLKNKILVAGAATAVGLSGLAGFGMVSAESANTNDGTSGLVDKLVSKFNLDKDEVQKVFDADRAEHEVNREKEQGKKLQSLVDEGTITASQKTAIEAKLKELKATRDTNKVSMKDLTQDERKVKMEQQRSSLEAWAKEQGIDLTKLGGVFMRGGFGGRGHGDLPLNSVSE
jgi:hypothetical protein